MDQLSQYIADAAPAASKISNIWKTSEKQFTSDYVLAQQANQNEIDMWKMQQEYNTPAAQMERLKAAGLNPNLAYQMANSGNSSSAPATHQQASTNYAQIKQAKVAEANMVMSNIMSLMDSAYNLAGKSMDLQQKQMQLNVDKNIYDKVFPTMGNGEDPAKYIYGFTGRFMPNSVRDNFKDVMLPFQMRGLDLSNMLKQFTKDEFYPIQRQLLQYQSDNAGYEAQKRDYNQQMLETMPPLFRQLMFYFEPVLGALTGVSNSAAGWYRATHPVGYRVKY